MVCKAAIVGAGPSGLAAIKACLEEGVVPMCFESSDDLGGLWRFKASENKKQRNPLMRSRQSISVKLLVCDIFLTCAQEVSEPNRASIYRSLTINISKEMMAYSDFPVPADYPNYMHHSKILDYFRMYAEHFKLIQHIHFQVTPTLPTEERPLQRYLYIALFSTSDLGKEREADAGLLPHWQMGSGD